MPRKPRLYFPDVPCHVLQRGNNRNAAFFDDVDRRKYLDVLASACRRYRVALHAYVLMTTHVHLLMTPQDGAGISRVMQSVGRCYVQYLNGRFRRSGTLWEGRHKSSLVCTESYLLTCMRYIELNPVRAGMVYHTAEYAWSSFGYNALGKPDPLLSPHSVYVGLGPNDDARRHAYRLLFAVALTTEELQDIRKASAFSMPLGNDRFREQIEAELGKSVGHAARGRPRTVTAGN